MKKVRVGLAKVDAGSEDKTIFAKNWRPLLRMAIVPLLVYFLFFCLFTWPWIIRFRDFFFTDSGDGLQNVWNMWWVNKSVMQLHQLPWHTTYLHFPFGVTLLGQTLNPFNGFVGIVLLKFMTLNQAFNVMVIFSFLFGGLSMFWLCHYFTKSYISSLIGGFIFTFSSYHFAHAIGHMQLVSLEWMPLFVLLWWKLVTKPRYWLAVAAAIVLLLVLFCDYYYFLYCVVAAGIIFIYLWYKKELAPIKDGSTYLPWTLFVVLCLLLVAPLPLALLRENASDPLQGAHNDRLFSTDLFSLVIDGGYWRFASLTYWYWRHIKAYVAESSVYFSLSVVTLLIIALWKRTKIHRDMVFWLVLGIIFAILSMGPKLMVVGHSINHSVLPYALLEQMLPTLKLSGDPDRIIVMSFLAAAIVASMVLSKLDLAKWRGRALVGIFMVILCVEVWPAPLPFTPAIEPRYTAVLDKLPSTGGVLDNAAISASFQLYHQTAFDKPMILGYISRTPQSVINEEQPLLTMLGLQQYDKLCQGFKIRYITTPKSTPLNTTLPIIYQDNSTLIYDLKNNPSC